MKNKGKNLKSTSMLVFGTFILGSIIWMVFIYNDLFGINSSELVSAGGDSYYEQTLPLVEKIELLETLEHYDERNSNLLMKYSKGNDALGYLANLKLARIFADNEGDATFFYKEALRLYETREIRYEYANYLIKRQNYNEAAKLLKDLLPDKMAIDKLIDLGITTENILMHLFEKRQWQSYVSYYEEYLGHGEFDLNSELRMKYAIALGNTGNYSRLLPIIEVLNNEISNKEIMFWYGRTLEEFGQIKEAINLYRKSEEFGAYRLGMLLEKEGLRKEAARAYVNSEINRSRWRGAQILDEMGYVEDALDIYLKIANEEGLYQDDAAYRAYIILHQNNTSGNYQGLMEILEKHPAWMVRIDKKPVFDIILDDNKEGSSELLQNVEYYKSIDRENLAKIELTILEANANKSEKVIIGEWYRDLDNYPMAVIWGIRALRDEPCRRAYELAYPRPFETVVYKWAEEYDVDPYLIWAVMREESHFRNAALSRVGAIGLMQIMPTTGQDIASRLKVDITNKELLIPEINIQFGTFYIRQMLNSFSGDIDKALAAYNGGGGNVRRWSRSNIGSSSMGFPTAITFQETREYITKVRNSYYTYKWLYEN